MKHFQSGSVLQLSFSGHIQINSFSLLWRVRKMCSVGEKIPESWSGVLVSSTEWRSSSDWTSRHFGAHSAIPWSFQQTSCLQLSSGALSSQPWKPSPGDPHDWSLMLRDSLCEMWGDELDPVIFSHQQIIDSFWVIFLRAAALHHIQNDHHDLTCDSSFTINSLFPVSSASTGRQSLCSAERRSLTHQPHALTFIWCHRCHSTDANWSSNPLYLITPQRCWREMTENTFFYIVEWTLKWFCQLLKIFQKFLSQTPKPWHPHSGFYPLWSCESGSSDPAQHRFECWEGAWLCCYTESPRGGARV